MEKVLREIEKQVSINMMLFLKNINKKKHKNSDL